MQSRIQKELSPAQQSWIQERFAARRAEFGDATMTGSDQPPADPPAGDPPADQPPAKPEKTFTQAEVNAIAAREKNEGKAAAERSVAEQLGVSLDEAKRLIAAAKEREDSEKTEAQRAKEAAEAEKTAAAAEKAAAAAEVHEARLERAFARAGLEYGDSDEDKAKVARIRRMVTVEAGASYEDVLADVEKIKADFPTLFGKQEEPDPKRRVAPGSDPKGNPPKPKGVEDKFAAGMARAQKHRTQYTGQPAQTA